VSERDVSTVDASDASGDVFIEKPHCDPRTEFSAPTPLTSLNTPEQEGSGRFRGDDETTIYFDAIREAGAGGNAMFDLFTATRLDRGDSFGPAVRIDGLSQPQTHEYSPSLTDDGTKLFFERQDASQTNSDIYVAQRETASGPFGPPSLVAGINTSGYEANPFVHGDGHELWFVATGADTTIDIFLGVLTPGGYAAHPVAELNSDVDDYYPVVTKDNLTVYFASQRPLGGAAGFNVWVATRMTPAETFGRPAPVGNVNSDGDERPTWISDDGCRLYIAADRDGGRGGQDIYVSSRGP
jgi:WD40-like Beta Propeller Repeat